MRRRYEPLAEEQENEVDGSPKHKHTNAAQDPNISWDNARYFFTCLSLLFLFKSIQYIGKSSQAFGNHEKCHGDGRNSFVFDDVSSEGPFPSFPL